MIEGVGTSLAAVFALVGIALDYVQIRGQRAIQREATAMDLYLQLALERPDLLHPDHADLARQVTYLRSADFQSKRGYHEPELITIIGAVCAEATAGPTPTGTCQGAVGRWIA